MVEEKVDGSQFSFGVFGGELVFFSKNTRVYKEAAGMFSNGVTAISNIADRLFPEWLYRGEYLQKPKHNVLAYDRTPANYVILFDVTTGPETYLGRGEKLLEADRIGLEVVPSFQVDVKNMGALQSLLNTQSVLGGQKVEGLVFKNYSRFGKDGKPLFGKYVSEAFREVAGGEWKAANPSKSDVIQLLINKLKTPARWNKAVQHLKEAGVLTNSPQDIGKLIKEVQEDIILECGGMIKDELYNWARGQIQRGVIGGLPEWYKLELAKSQFEQGEQK